VTYVQRLADHELKASLEAHPAVLVVGPRATGKTTSAASLASSVLSLAEPNIRQAIAADPLVGLSGRSEPILIDEWQLVPEALNAVKVLTDADARRGRFLLTGSVRGDLDSPTWPGTGRLVRVPMYGLIEREIEGRVESASWMDRLLEGRFRSVDAAAGADDVVRSTLTVRDYVGRALRSGFPEPALHLDERSRERWLGAYVDQLVTRDAEGIEGGRDPDRLRRYLQAVALNSAAVVDDVTLFEAARINKKTAKAYERLLRNLLVVDQVPAWTPNALKRLSLAPKRYLVDAGLFVGVLGINERDVLTDGMLMGRVIDTFVTAQLRAEMALRSPRVRVHHLRADDGRRELDLVLEVGHNKVIGIEIKSTASPTNDDARHLRWFRDRFGEAVLASVLFHTGPDSFWLTGDVLAAPIASLWH
jgi:uncharacterized protein